MQKPAFRVLALVGWWMLATFLASLGSAAEAAPDAAPVAGIRQVRSRHLTLYTDLPADPEVDVLGEVFDQACGQWCAYFGLDENESADWHVRAYLMKAKQRFVDAGLLPADLPEFRNGFARADQIFLNEQASPYYRRHLLLHEGTHALMYARLGDVGPPWFAEGLAELLGTHRWQDGRLTLNYFPRAPDEVPLLGRVEIIEAAVAAGHALSLQQVLDYDPRSHLENERYGWCWALAALLDGHPRYRERFRALKHLIGKDHFAAGVQKTFGEDWPRLAEDWQRFVAHLDYGYDFERMEVEFAPGKPLSETGATATVAADRGWQSSGIRLEAGHKYQLRGAGRYVVAQEPRAWPCEPGGVTIHYYRGQPLGVLLAAVVADAPVAGKPNGLLKPVKVGLGTTLTVKQPGTLYFRVNDSAGSLADNSGSLEVRIVPAKAEAPRKRTDN